MFRFRFLYVMLAFCACLLSCTENYDHRGKHPLVEVQGHFLYQEDLLAMIPAGISKEDSASFSKNYIHGWIEDVLLFEKAKRNIPNTEAIERLVDNYRKSLIVSTYQQELIAQELSEEISEEEIQRYFDLHSDLFKLDKPLLKGLFIKVPLVAPQIDNVRRWYQSEKLDAVERLEKYSFQNAVKYEYFYDRWVPLSEVMGMMPLKVDNVDEFLVKKKHVEVKDTAYYYFLNVTDFLPAGEPEPYVYARAEVKDMLLNIKQVEFLRQVKNDLFDKAVKNEKIKYNYREY